MTVNVGNQLRFVFPDAEPGRSYYFAVASYASGNVVGPLSAEVSGRIDGLLQLSNPGDITSFVNVPATVQLTASASAAGALTYEASGLPYGVAIDAANGLISGRPSIEGFYRVTVTVSSGLNVASESFNWTVTRHHSKTPAVMLTIPTSGSRVTTSKSSVLLGGVAVDDQSVTAVQWKNDRGGFGRATGTDQWMAAVPLRMGNNEITITVVDDNSSRSAIRVSIYRTTTAPRSPPRLGLRAD